MAKRTPANIRNIAVLGHGGSGKTTFVDNLLHAVGAVNRAGSVPAGTSLSDYTDEEKERQFSMDSAIFHFEAEGKAFNVIDTPGYLEFSGAAQAAIPAVETALIAVSAADGVQINTRRMWEAAGKVGVARMIMITRMDLDSDGFEKILADVREDFGAECAPVFLPIGDGSSFSGVVNLLEADAAPDGVVGDFGSLKEALRESIIESDDDLLERFYEEEEITADELVATFKAAVAKGALVPVICCAAEKGIGLKEAVAFLADCAPSPVEGLQRTAVDGEEEVELKPDPDAPICGQVFKSVIDAHVGRLVFFRVFQGSASAGDVVGIVRTRDSARLGHLNVVFGEEQKEVESAVPGDIICVSKVEELHLNDVIGPEKSTVDMTPIELPKPMMALAVVPKSRDDEQKITAGLQKLADSDPTFTVERRKQSGELVITGMSNLHLDIMLGKLKARYGVECDTHEPAIPYMETITKTAEGQYRHKKQTGGRGQFGDVHLRLEPNERGAGFEFVDEIKGGVIPSQYLPAIEKGIRETLDHGILAGCPIVDVKAVVFFGSYHTVDSSEAAFKTAGSRAFQLTFEKCSPVLLEPIAKVDVTIPAQYVGDIMGNLIGHRAKIMGQDQIGRMQVLTAEIPMAEIRRYSTELQSMTGGEGTFTMEFSHYETVPSHVQQEIVASHSRKKDDDE